MKKFLFILMIFFGAFFVRAERVSLITTASQLSVSNIAPGSYIHDLLNDYGVVNSRTGELDEECYIQVKLNQPLNLGATDDLIVSLRRGYDSESGSHPTTLRVEGSFDGVNWDEKWDDDINTCHVYFMFRGPKTVEYSTRIRTSKQFNYLRFTVTANSGRRHDSKGHRYMSVNQFQLYQIGRDDNYSPELIDRFHLTTDYAIKLKNYEYVNTPGILEPLNRKGGRETSLDGWCDWDAWVDGKWTKDTEFLEKSGIKMPDYSMLTSENDTHGYRPDPDQKRQPTHTTEHILYAVPGEAIVLYPYYKFATAYQTNFVHWYDYRTGGNITVTDETTQKTTALLDFLTDPSAIYKSESYGYYGGPVLPVEYPQINTPDEYIAYVNLINSYGDTGCDLKFEITADLDFSGKTVEPIGRNFEGIIEGNGHRISNLVMNYPDRTNVGIVGHCGNGSAIRNLIIDSSCRFIGKNKVAAIAGEDINGNGRNIDNVQSYAYVKATDPDGYAAGIIGYYETTYNPGDVIKNCFVGGTVEAAHAAAVVNCFTNGNFSVRNTLSLATVDSGDGYNKFAGGTLSKSNLNNCYGNYDDITGQLPDDLNSDEFIAKLGNQWVKGPDGHAIPDKSTVITFNKPDNGKVATFFCPRSPYADDGVLQNLPFRPGEDEFVIAADFSQSFSRDFNIDDNNSRIIEPIIQFRHIFRIRDGRKFAEEFSGSVENNRQYVRNNLRRVSARAGVPFQIRLDSPVPLKGTTRSKYYYKISDTDYRRVCTMDIEVIDMKTGQTIQRTIINPAGQMTDESGNNIMAGNKPIDAGHFYYGETFNGEGARKIGGTTYNICGGGGSYYRMLKCEAPSEGHYLIRITGNDINTNPIKIIGSDEPLVVMEMELSVLPESAASLVDEDTLYGDNKTYEHAREEALEDAYGEPKQRLTFDEYVALESLPNSSDYFTGGGNSRKLKWPLPWEDVTYSFDYNDLRDFNMYGIASKSEQFDIYSYAAAQHKNPDGTNHLYDRLYYKTYRQTQNPKSKHGYFYFVNAAEDPGIMARLRLNSLCMGSTIHVSAWVAEFSLGEERANIAFNFVAVLNEANGKRRVPLHTFISGYLPKAGEWMNIYYSFVPNYSDAGISSDMIDHYELELDNNCRSSSSADYAIDNIRLYVADPTVSAFQNEPVCGESKDVAVRVETPFETLLQIVGETETDDDSKSIRLYYTFIDKDKFDKTYNELKDTDPEPGRKAYEAAVLRYDYNSGGEGDMTFGNVSFNLNYDSNEEYNNRTDISTQAYRKISKDGTRMIALNTRPNDNALSTAKEYYVSIYPEMAGSGVTTPSWPQFDILDPCARVCIFKVKPRSTIKVDGELREETDSITSCKNQSPVIQVDLWGKTADGDDIEPIEKNAMLDWYNGTYDEFNAESFDAEKSLRDILLIFRSEYPDTETCDVEPAGDLTDDMLAYLKSLTEDIRDGESCPRLRLLQTSYVFPPVQIPESEEDGICYVVAIPVNAAKENILVCSDPTEVRIHVKQTAPALNHGLGKIEYPEGMADVPIRIGLNQLKATSSSENSDLSQHIVKLNVPVRRVVTGSQSSEEMQLIAGSPYIYLVETNDPDYEDLGTVDDTGNDTGTLMTVGEITNLTAKVIGQHNIFMVVFYDTFIFKEGYYYRIRFSFKEDSQDENVEGNCYGQDVFTLKVVPEYQRWTGDAPGSSRNWNNDANWSRVSADELNLTAERAATLTDFVSDGSNNRQHSYAPLDFSKVIIPAGDTFPYLDSYAGDGSEDLSADYPDITTGVIWTKNPSTAAAGDATDNIQYDMAAYTSADAQINCRPWYANTCAQIHFRPNSEIEGQQNLIYQKAWVDIATVPARWYTLATPLKTVYAGDMYLPSDNARQESELFEDIIFDAARNNRFSPAVYQRGWNKSTTTVYELDGNDRNVAVKADWSNVYNDVAEVYGGGVGFSIKTDASKSTGNKGEVLFRLPKSDTFFDYYSEDGTTVGNRTAIDRADNFRLNDAAGTIKAVSRGDNRYFLVGNPFMAHLDMQAFISGNADKINPKYWLLTADTQGVAVFDKNTAVTVGSASDKIAPLQGFFVEAKDGAATVTAGGDTQLELTYTPDMSCTASFGDASLQTLSRSSAGGNIVTISAVRDNIILSQAFINISPDAEGAYNETNDAVLIENTRLDIPAAVYTVADKVALSVNTTDSADGTEIGLVSADNEETELVFDGVGALSGLSLYDAATGEYTGLYDGMEYSVNGAASGRLYLLSDRDNPDMELQSVKVNINGRRVRVEAGCGTSVSASVYTIEGIKVFGSTENSKIMEFSLDKGLYILEASDDIETVNRKIFIR